VGILILGYGNTLRGDDAFGPRVAELLLGRVQDPSVEILSLHQLTPELMEPLSRAALAIFIDAAAVGEPGAIVERRLDPAAAPAAFTHHATPEGLLAGARALYGCAPEAVLISVAAADFGLGAELSPAVSSHLDEVADTALRLAMARCKLT
jgi:hydrogenase maturation protease